MSPKKSSLRCSFCGMPIKDKDFCINGIDGVICENCVEAATEIMRDYNIQFAKHKKSELKFKLLKPIEIKEKLDEYVIGQEEAKKEIGRAHV